MAIRGFFSKQFIDIIDWLDEAGTLCHRFETDDHAIKNGAQLTVREGQKVAFMNEGQMADIFGPGRYTLDTATLPLLTALENWDKGFRSPFKSDVFFFSLREQVDRRWGTPQPITVNDPALGVLRLRAHGRYSFIIDDVILFWTALVGNQPRFTLDDIEPQLRGAMLTALASRLGKGDIAFADMAGGQSEMSTALAAAVAPEFKRFGLSLTGFLVESLSLPDDVQAAIDTSAAARLLGRGPAAHEPEDPYLAIEKLHKLLQAGAISQAEFDAKKAALLARIS